ncbi:uncharacterized protein TNCV_14641 [Trichonephila clavipes]|nr:uncharacterized protein TNCV_14641 [Trichonephila clavipes]
MSDTYNASHRVFNVPIARRLDNAYTLASENIFAEIHREIKNVYENGAEITDLSVSFHGTWLTRGHTSLIGVGCVIDMLTGYVVDFEVMRTPINEKFLPKILPIYQRLASNELLERCIRCGTQNANESLHSMIWAKCRKEIFVNKRRVKRAVTEAVCEYNKGTVRTIVETQKALGVATGGSTKQLATILDCRKQKFRKRRQNASRHEDLFVLATELNLEFDKSMTIATLKDLIIGNENYDEELTKNIHSTIEQEKNLRIEEQIEKLRIEERQEKLRIAQLRLDEQKHEYEFELEKLRIRTQSKLGADTSKESDIKFLVKEVSKFIHPFDLKEDISLYLKFFVRQAQRLNINQENWVSHLLGLLPTEVSHIIVREPDDKANSYEHVKYLLLKRFKLSPEKFRQLFVTHQKAPERTWIDFYHELKICDVHPLGRTSFEVSA